MKTPEKINLTQKTQDTAPPLRHCRTGCLRGSAVSAAAIFLAATSAGRAAEFRVKNLNDAGPGSLRAAIEAANATAEADVITVHGGLQGAIFLTSGQLNIGTDLTIRGSGQDKLVVSGNDARRVFRIDAPARVEISHLTIADGLATDFISGKEGFGYSTGGGGILNLGGSLALSHVTLANNVSDTLADFRGEPGKPDQSYGGAIYNRSGATLSASHCTFSENLATAAIGGATSFQFHGGGAIFNDDRSTAVIQHCLFHNNLTTDAGGAIYNSAGSSMVISQSRFHGNSAYFAAGAIESAPNGLSAGAATTTTLEHCSFAGNRVIGNLFPGGGASGGAIRAVAGVLNVRHSSFLENEARGGDHLGGNGGVGRGGAIYMARTVVAGVLLPFEVSITNCGFRDNRALGGTGSTGKNGGEGRGGALAGLGVGVLEVSNSRVEDNEAQGGTGGAGGIGGLAQGGGLYSDAFGGASPTVTVSNTQIAGNVVRSGVGTSGGNAFGGGIYNGPALGTPIPEFNMTHCTITDNAAEGGEGQGVGGGIYNLGSFHLDATFVHGNTASTSDSDLFGVVIPL